MTPVGVFFCWQGGAERDFVNSTRFWIMSAAMKFFAGSSSGKIRKMAHFSEANISALMGLS